MELRRLGRTDLCVSVVGLGGNNFGWKADLAGARSIIDRALACGVNFLDTADSYGPSEDFIGEILGERRKNVVLATKFGSPMDSEGLKKGASRAYLTTAVESSLRRLRTDWIDLYQLHYPDPATPIEETLRALEDLITQGKVRAIGCSNLSAAQLGDAQETARRIGLTGFASTQNEYNLLVRNIESDLGPQIAKYELALLPYFPLANGLLTGKYKPGQAAPAGSRLADAPPFFDSYREAAKWRRPRSSRPSPPRAGTPFSNSPFPGSPRNPASRVSLPARADPSRSNRMRVRRAGYSRAPSWPRSTA